MHASAPGLRHAAFEDGLGKRHHANAPNGELLEVLELRDEFATETFERSLRERITGLGGFHTTWFSHVRTVQRVNQSGSTLFVVYDRVPGARLTTLLAARQEPVPLEINATLYLIRQLVAAIALLHEKLPGVGHGAISLERVIITPDARVVVADHVLGLALAELGYSPARYWNELRIALPSAEPAFDQRTDVVQIGTLALELILGRRIEPTEYPERLPELLERAWQSAAVQPLPGEFRAWLLRMLQLDTRQPYTSAVDAWADLETILGSRDNGTSFVALKSIMAEYTRRASAISAGLSGTPASDGSPEIAAVDPADVTPPAPSAAEEVAAPDHPLRSLQAPADSPEYEAEPGPAEPRTMPVEQEAGEEDVEKTMPTRRRWIAAAAVVVLLGSGVLFGRHYLLPAAAAEAPGTLVVTTNPAGFQVFIDGQPRGVTPLSVELAPGSHELKVATEGEPRVIPFTVTAGSTVAQAIEVPRAAPRTGQLMVRSEPAGARVTIDNILHGTTPLTIDGLAPGTHSVTLQSDLSSVTQDVTIEPGDKASLVVPMTAPQGVPVSGWISVAAPAEVQVYEDGRLLGSSQSDRIMVSAGAHALEIVNEALGYRTTRSVVVAPGKVAAVRLEWPMGSMALNAQPWAEVWVNGRPVGETPIGSIAVPIGTHEVIFRHPELGQQTVRATVTATTPARVIVDLRKR